MAEIYLISQRFETRLMSHNGAFGNTCILYQIHWLVYVLTEVEFQL